MTGSTRNSHSTPIRDRHTLMSLSVTHRATWATPRDEEVIEKAMGYAGYIGSQPKAKRIEDTPKHGGTWAAEV